MLSKKEAGLEKSGQRTAVWLLLLLREFCGVLYSVGHCQGLCHLKKTQRFAGVRCRASI